ncbi:SbcC/MukB-like Walker B domain-containing protein [Luteolibacter algae]|uniref:SbcC/MukB-like Walker B domain-containing protein n=1 Tax=Luteolibacter algae TaxID=454151 RepID=A0ABW5D776_9BACT
MSRAIQLTKIHALNWYGYRDSLPVKGNLVLAGVTGSGKSILMDLLMLVLVGPERARHHFNRSATGSRSDRTIKGYCLLDTKREENGQPQYFHDKGVTTYIGGEFTWPEGSVDDTGGRRIETWGIRFEFRNSSENDGFNTPFYCPAPLEREDFLSVSPEDGKLRTSSLAEFKAMIESRGGRLFTSSREYLRDMANASHLNFNKEVLERLLPSAMSFTNLKSFDDFCRQFVLPGEAVPVDDVISSFRDFESYERELRELRAQLDRLLVIRKLASTLHEAQRDGEVASYLAAENHHSHAQETVEQHSAHLQRLQDEFAEDEARLQELSGLLGNAEAQRDQLSALLNESSEGRLYNDLAVRTRKLEEDIDRLRAIASRIESGISARLKSARSWIEEMAKAPVEPKVFTTAMEEAIGVLDSCEREETSHSLSMLADAADKLCRQLRDRFREDSEDLRDLREERTKLESQIESLRRGLPPVSQPFLTALREALPQLPGEAEPRALRELCEIKDETWRPAAEVSFSEKFAVVVPPQHQEQAAKILDQISERDMAEAGPQSLVDPDQLLSGKTDRIKNSFADIFETSDPIARAYIDREFGHILRADDLDGMSEAPFAIRADGLMKRGGIISRPFPYDGVPFIGENGLKRQLEIKRARLDKIDAKLRRLEPLEREVERLLAAREQAIPDHSEVSRELIRVEDLPRKQADQEELMAQLHAISTDELASLEEKIDILKEQMASWAVEEKEILRKGGHKEIKQAEEELKARTEDASRREDEFSRAKLRIDIHKHHERYVAWKAEAEEYTPAADVRAREFSKAAAAAELMATQTIGDLKVAMMEFKKTFHPKFDDLPEDGTDTAPYERILALIEDADIPKFEKKSANERKRWESLFRTQVLSRMQQAIKNVENIISLLNQQLKRPIGHDRYKIDRRPNPDFNIYRSLIDLNSLHHEDELFYSHMDGELKDALELFLTTLVKNANSPEAARLLDYRQYFDYDLLVTDVRDPDGKHVSVDKQSGKMSGGENQSPYFVAILASYLHAYNRHETRRKEPSLALVPIDEAFSKLSGERIQNCLQAMAELDLQGMFSMSSGNIPYAFSQCDELIIITRKEVRRGTRVGTRNVPVVLFRDSPEGKKWIEETGLAESVQ